MENRAGGFINNLSGKMAYKSFRPSPLPPVPPINIDSEQLQRPFRFSQRKKFFPRQISLEKQEYIPTQLILIFSVKIPDHTRYISFQFRNGTITLHPDSYLQAEAFYYYCNLTNYEYQHFESRRSLYESMTIFCFFGWNDLRRDLSYTGKNASFVKQIVLRKRN